MEDIATICSRAETLLAQVFRTPIHLAVLEQFESDHAVLRCAVQAEKSPYETPDTVILKQRHLATPRSPDDFDQAILFGNECASLDFLASVAGNESLSPRVYASDRQSGLVVVEDLGKNQTVQEVLYSNDREAAIDALVKLGTYLGRLQAVTWGHEQEFTSRQATLGTYSTVCYCSRDLRANLDDLHACLDGLGIQADSRFDRSVQALEEAIHGPGTFRTFVHHDAGPHNFVTTPGGVKLLDFEFAGFANGLLDMVCARLAYPPAFRGRCLPPEVVLEMEEHYRAELATRVPAIQDENLFAEGVAQACAHWAFSTVFGLWNNYLKSRLAEGKKWDVREGRAPERAAFFRQQAFTPLRLALATMEEKDRLPELRFTLDRIVAQLLHLWPDTPFLPAFPAFGGEPWHYP